MNINRAMPNVGNVVLWQRSSMSGGQSGLQPHRLLPGHRLAGSKPRSAVKRLYSGTQRQAGGTLSNIKSPWGVSVGLWWRKTTKPMRTGTTVAVSWANVSADVTKWLR